MCITILAGKNATSNHKTLIGHNEDAPGKFLIRTHILKALKICFLTFCYISLECLQLILKLYFLSLKINIYKRFLLYGSILILFVEEKSIKLFDTFSITKNKVYILNH